MSANRLLSLCSIAAAALWFSSAGPCQADAEARLLSKFRQQNQDAASKLKKQVESDLVQAEYAGRTDPAKAVQTLRNTLGQLQEDDRLAREERQDFISRVETQLRRWKEVVAEKQKEEAAKREREAPLALKSKPQGGSASLGDQGLFAARPSPGRGPSGVSPFFAPQFTPVPIGGSFSATPVISGDRTSVRVGVSGTFSMPNLNAPLVPIQVPVPTILYGPGKNKTVTTPQTIFQIFLPRISAGSFGVNSTVSVPDGGAALLGSFSSLAESRGEFGPPGLSQLPYAGRLFRNVGYGRQIQSTSLQVSARIIILEELEPR
jgi:hypothetical protein